jgi:hypothetical protein
VALTPTLNPQFFGLNRVIILCKIYN